LSASGIPPSDELRVQIANLEKNQARLAAKLEQLTTPASQGPTAWTTAGAVVLAALVAGVFALRNQNRQAAQERLLKAVEIIMDSRNGYQADVRTKNLSGFLDDETRSHLASIRNSFSGPEYTDVRRALAESMATKAATPAEVLAIWQAALDDNQAVIKVKYP